MYSDHTLKVVPHSNLMQSHAFLGLLYRDDIETLFSLWPNAMYVYVDTRLLMAQ